MSQATFQCSCCGETLNGPVYAWHFDAPDQWLDLSEAERDRRGELSSDQCVIDNEHFFVRGVVEIPIVDSAEIFSYGVWVSLSAKNFRRSSELWDDEQRIHEPAYFGYLCNAIPGYPDSMFLKTAVHSRPVGLRPLIELEATDHPLAVDQRNGITMARVRQITEEAHHSGQ